MGVAMDDLTAQIAAARSRRWRNRRRAICGADSTDHAAAGGLGAVAGGAGRLMFLAARISRPVQQLTQGLGRVAAGDLAARVEPGGSDEIGAAVEAFNHMAEPAATGSRAADPRHAPGELAGAGAQDGARSEEFADADSLDHGRDHQPARASPDGAFLEQAAQIVADEVQTLEKRVRAFSEFAAEPPVMPSRNRRERAGGGARLVPEDPRTRK